MPHPHLWPALIGAIIGLVLIIWACIWLARKWDGLQHRWWFVVAIAVFELAYWGNVYAWLIEPNRLVVRHVEIVSDDWRGAPITIAALADTHVASPHVDAARMGRIVSRVNRLRPDLVVLLGDYAAGHAPEAERSGAERQEILGGIGTFAALNAPLGAVAVIGNHDVWYNRAAITEALQNAGIAALWNSHVVIPRQGGEIIIAGLEDDMTADPDFAAALDGAPTGDTIVLSHSPDPFERMPDGPALMLAGHGHCGQVTVPLLGRPILPLRNKRYGCGRIEENGHTMIVSAGIGTSILPVRFLNPPEIVLIRLRGRGQSGGAGRA